MPLYKILDAFLFVKNDIGISFGIIDYFGSWLKRTIPIMDRGHSGVRMVCGAWNLLKSGKLRR